MDFIEENDISEKHTCDQMSQRQDSDSQMFPLFRERRRRKKNDERARDTERNGNVCNSSLPFSFFVSAVFRHLEEQCRCVKAGSEATTGRVEQDGVGIGVCLCV